MWFRPNDQWPDEAKDGSINYPDIAKYGAPWDIIRNHIYEFVITGVEAASGNLNVQVSITPWEKHEMPTEWYGE